MKKVISMVIVMSLVLSLFTVVSAAEPSSTTYRIIRTDGYRDLGYVDVINDKNPEDISRIITGKGNGYVKVPAGYSMIAEGVTLKPIDLSKIKFTTKKVVGDGIYIVGTNKDLAPGEYKIKVIDSTNSEVKRLASINANPNGSIIDTVDLSKGTLIIQKGDYAIQAIGVILTKVK